MTFKQHVSNILRGMRRRGAAKKQADSARKEILYWFGTDGSRRLDCAYCDTDLEPTKFSLDHCLPLSRGGTHSRNNLRICCARCNRAKGDMTTTEYLRLLAFLKNDLPYISDRILGRLAAGGYIYGRRK